MNTEAGTNESQLAADSDGCVDLDKWPDELIRAVAIAAPELFRSGDPYACPERGLRGYAQGLALVSLEEEDLGYLDVDGYAKELRERHFRRFDIADGAWFVADWERDATPEPDLDLPRSFQSLSVEAWPDDLIAAVGAQAPALLRTERGDAWALTAAEFPRLALFWLFEAYCDPMLYRHVDLDLYTEDLRRGFTAVDVASARWYVRVDDPQPVSTEPSDQAASPAQTVRAAQAAQIAGRSDVKLADWPDALVAVVSATWPQVFRTNDYEMVSAVPDERLSQVIADWAEGRDEEVEQAGGLAAWQELVVAEDFRPVDFDGRRWWVYIADWERWPAK